MSLSPLWLSALSTLEDPRSFWNWAFHLIMMECVLLKATVSLRRPRLRAGVEAQEGAMEALVTLVLKLPTDYLEREQGTFSHAVLGGNK